MQFLFFTFVKGVSKMMFRNIINRLNQPMSIARLPLINNPLKVRPTKAGSGFGSMIFCGFLMSANFSSNLIFALTFLLAGIALVSWYQTRTNLRRLKLGHWRCQPVFAGQNGVYRLAVSNGGNSKKFAIIATTIQAIPGETQLVASKAHVEFSLEQPAVSRGFIESAPAYLTSQFPLGIYQAKLCTENLPKCLVYPTPKGNQSLPGMRSDQQAHKRHESGSFTDMRRYVAGDPPSRIAWQALARTDEIYTKEFDGAQGESAIWLDWDLVKAPSVEERLSQLCQWVLEAERQDKEYGLDLPGVLIPPAKTKHHQWQCLRVLALYDLQGQGTS